MKYQKKVISDLNLCYSLAELTYKGQHCFLVAAEKHCRAMGWSGWSNDNAAGT